MPIWEFFFQYLKYQKVCLFEVKLPGTLKKFSFKIHIRFVFLQHNYQIPYPIFYAIFPQCWMSNLNTVVTIKAIKNRVHNSMLSSPVRDWDRGIAPSLLLYTSLRSELPTQQPSSHVAPKSIQILSKPEIFSEFYISCFLF